jgi:uncharacterized membrane protein YdjX (TVP38/TMEM64 family)
MSDPDLMATDDEDQSDRRHLWLSIFWFAVVMAAIVYPKTFFHFPPLLILLVLAVFWFGKHAKRRPPE